MIQMRHMWMWMSSRPSALTYSEIMLFGTKGGIPSREWLPNSKNATSFEQMFRNGFLLGLFNMDKSRICELPFTCKKWAWELFSYRGWCSYLR